jgi:RHH-type rel operon transcriptional repressor/antitoxin RelB
MDVKLSAVLEAKLSRMASAAGRETAELVSEAVERYVECQEWFLREVENGIAQADRGELLEHNDVVARVEKRLRDKLPTAG